MRVPIIIELLLLFFGAHYRHNQGVLLNDERATPGAVSARTAKELCAPAFRTGVVRHVTETEKHTLCAEYGLDNCKGVEIDHLISLEIGGTNEISNLWPQPYEPRPGAHEKDALEDRLHAMVCRGDISLTDAQKAIATDWYAEYKRLGLDRKVKLGTFEDKTK